jgi:hypothetical protein
MPGRCTGSSGSGSGGSAGASRGTTRHGSTGGRAWMPGRCTGSSGSGSGGSAGAAAKGCSPWRVHEHGSDAADGWSRTGLTQGAGAPGGGRGGGEAMRVPRGKAPGMARGERVIGDSAGRGSRHLDPDPDAEWESVPAERTDGCATLRRVGRAASPVGWTLKVGLKPGRCAKEQRLRWVLRLGAWAGQVDPGRGAGIAGGPWTGRRRAASPVG